MKKFLALYIGTMHDESFKKWNEKPEAERKELEQKGMAAWGAWMEKHKGVIVDAGGPIGKTKLADMNGVSDTKNAISGYVIVEAESHEEAAKLFLQHPHFTIFPGASVEIMECLPMPEM